MNKTTVLALLLALAGTAQAQHIYIDSNGNGLHDDGDQLNQNGFATTVDIWLTTDLNRDGNPPPPDVSGEERTINSYVINLLASNGTVTYTNFVNRQATMSVHFLEVNPDGLRYKNGSGGGTILPPGKYRLCTLTITGMSGTPKVDFVDIVEGSQDFTSFGSKAWGQAFDNTYKLDGPVTQEVQGIGDFFDADGLAKAQGPLVTNPGNKTVARGESLQFGVVATDPGHTLTYAIALGVPAATGASIHPVTGVFSWTPSATQAPGSYPVTLTVTNNAPSPQSGGTLFTITVTEAGTADPAAIEDEEKVSCAGSAAGLPGLAWIVAIGALLVSRR